MRLTTKGRFAVTAMIDLALRDEGGPVTLAAISERQGISLSYLEQLFGKLRRHSIVESVRGPGGGYTMARTLDTVTVADIIAAVDEPLDATMCGGKENCHETGRIGGGLQEGAQKGQCMTHDLWATLNKKMHEYLESVTLGHLVRQQREREAATQVAQGGVGAVQSVMVDRRKTGGVRGTPAIA
jgi:Rrf2 family iron-sulfur cluster assembly transcriptional regulator